MKNGRDAVLKLSQNYRRDELCESPTYEFSGEFCEFSGELGARVTRPSDNDMLLRQPRLRVLADRQVGPTKNELNLCQKKSESQHRSAS
jgi:hypothetical protein